MINKNNGKNEDKNSSISLTLFFVILTALMMTSGSAATLVFAATQPATALPTCTDPTGQNLPCMMIISTLPPPTNTIQCQETSGQILPCSYATQNLSNGEQVVVITVYVPANYVFTGYGPWTVVKQVIHETTTKTRIVPEPCPKGQTLDPKTHKCASPTCQPGQHKELVNGQVKCVPPCERHDSDAKTDPDKNLKTADCDINDANEHRTSPLPSPICNSPNGNITCAPTNNSKTSGGSGPGPTCVNNCTTGTPPTVDCTKNPNDSSCGQTLTPSTTTPTTKTCPDGSVIDASTNCPTQSTPPTNPNTPPTPTPPSTSGTPPPPASNNPGPPSDNNIPPSGGSGSSGGSSSSGGSGGGA